MSKKIGEIKLEFEKASRDEWASLYEKYADVIVDESGLNIEETREVMEKMLQEYWT